jgi:MoxR-like ATPase
VTSLSRATAFLRGRDYVIPEDVRFIWRDGVAHRLLLPTGAAGSAQRAGQIADEVLHAIQPPRIR